MLYILAPLLHVPPVIRLPGFPPIYWLNNPHLFGWPGAVLGTWMTLIGMVLVITGWVLHWATTLTVVMYPILLVVYFYLERQEEAALEREFGAEYVAYRQNTPMFLPIRWKVSARERAESRSPAGRAPKAEK